MELVDEYLAVRKKLEEKLEEERARLMADAAVERFRERFPVDPVRPAPMTPAEYKQSLEKQLEEFGFVPFEEVKR